MYVIFTCALYLRGTEGQDTLAIIAFVAEDEGDAEKETVTVVVAETVVVVDKDDPDATPLAFGC
jgi:hypothetical protein